ncbi:Hypothetical_protein [Hexamita inflata]|uniref:Hypothetical_protein n=1 Tax=Hexamita inflata TaxID=28002 RepID=A0AA86P720_9EUKA|nr:Hypothetical protein HINF_LOCUS20405 [Hexamita inflata]
MYYSIYATDDPDIQSQIFCKSVSQLALILCQILFNEADKFTQKLPLSTNPSQQTQCDPLNSKESTQSHVEFYCNTEYQSPAIHTPYMLTVCCAQTSMHCLVSFPIQIIVKPVVPTLFMERSTQTESDEILTYKLDFSQDTIQAVCAYTLK